MCVAFGLMYSVSSITNVTPQGILGTPQGFTVWSWSLVQKFTASDSCVCFALFYFYFLQNVPCSPC